MKLKDKIDELNNRFNALVEKSPKTAPEMQEKEEVRIALEEALRIEAKPLTDDLLRAGIDADIWDLVNTDETYAEAVPVLVRHLSESYHQRTKAGIVRALAVKEARGIANKAIMNEYHKAPKNDYHFSWLFGNTMSAIVTKDDLDELIDIVLDETNGDSRDSFVLALGKLKSPRVQEVLNQLVNDSSPLVSQDAQKALKRISKEQERKTKTR